MKLVQKYSFNSKLYCCELTRKLDELCEYTINHPRYKNYIVDTRDLWKNCFAVRAQGRTIGTIEIDNNNKIIRISIAKDLVGEDKQFPANVQEKVEKYIGEVLEI